jgi:hypothetical protein
VSPPDEGLEAVEAIVRERHNRLEVKRKLLAGQFADLRAPLTRRRRHDEIVQPV